MTFRNLYNKLLLIFTYNSSQTAFGSIFICDYNVVASRIDRQNKKKILVEKSSCYKVVLTPVILLPSYFLSPNGATHISFAFVPIIHLLVGNWMSEVGFDLFLPCSPYHHIFIGLVVKVFRYTFKSFNGNPDRTRRA